MEQLSLFSFEVTPSSKKGKVVIEVSKVADVRTHAQKSNLVAIDVGEVVNGSAKQQAQERINRAFVESPTRALLVEAEDISEDFAQLMVKKEVLFQSFSLEQEKENDIHVEIAKLKESLIKRISPEASIKTRQGRLDYLILAESFLEDLEDISNWDEFLAYFKCMNNVVVFQANGLAYYERRVETWKKHYESDTYDEFSLRNHGSEERVKARRLQLYEQAKNQLEEAMEAVSLSDYRTFGKSFTNFFTDPKSANQTIRRIQSQKWTWDKALAKKEPTKRKAPDRWERELPEHPQRIGPVVPSISNPKQMVENVGFRAIQFGHYVNDQTAMKHLVCSMEALYDLSSILEVDIKALSLEGKLALAFGARGKGRALAHFEPFENIINMTKEKGCLGVFAHEWYHALDLFLYRLVRNTERIGYLSEAHVNGTSPLLQALVELQQAIFQGHGVEYIDNGVKEGDSWKVSDQLKRLYQAAEGNVNEVIKFYYNKLIVKYNIDSKTREETRRFYLNLGSSSEDIEKKLNKDEKRFKREIRNITNAVCWYHEKQTGIFTPYSQVPSTKSQYFLNSIAKDRGKEGKYWSSGRELFARAFESYVYDELKKRNCQNDYLVAGVNHSLAYPQGEERDKINEKMDTFIRILSKEMLGKG